LALSYSDDQGLVSAALVLDKDYLLDIDERHLMMRTRNANTFIGRLFCANFVSTLVALFAGSLGTCSATSYEDDASKSQLIVPGHTAYILPDPWGLRVRENAGVQWSSASQSIQWTGLFRQAGILKIQVVAACTKEQAARLELEVLGKSLQLVSDNTLGEPSGSIKRVLDFGQVELEHASPAYISLMLKLRDSQGEDAGLVSKSQPIQVVELRLDGPGAQEAHFNLKERRNAASVHLSYVTEQGAKVDAFYTEVQAIEEPVGTFYMACGWHRGYFGMQVNSKTERRIIFSVWDSGNEATDRDKVADENRVRLLNKGEGVFSGDFGNEGTGGHSHLKYMWKTGSLQRFLVTSESTDDTHTTFSGYWFHPENKSWMLISAWNAPKEGKTMRGLHSFSENFLGENGHLPRKALFGNSWYRTLDGAWHEITTAKFSHDETGKADRLDRTMGIENNSFFLRHGGFLDGFTKYGEPFTRDAGPGRPTDFDALLPKVR
jgi:hypothetical protein